MDPMLAGVASSVLVEGAKFLYQQASEVLSLWRAGRHAGDGRQLPKTMPPPEGVEVRGDVIATAAPSSATEATFAAATDLVGRLAAEGLIGSSPEASQAVFDLRDLCEAACRMSIRFAGEARPSVEVNDIEVVAGMVSGRVRGLRASLDKLGDTSIRGVHVRVEDVHAGGDVAGVDLG
jgi:hypothetical protein